MKKYWKVGSVILILAFAIAIFSISMASKDKSISNASPEIAQRRPGRAQSFRKMMKEEGISPEDLKDNPELQKTIREKARKLREERLGDAEPRQSKDKSPKPTKSPETTEVVTTKRKEKNEEDYYKLIVEKNLFRPLGSGAEKKGPVFGLLGTVIAKSEGEVNKALIMDYRRNQSVYVAEGEKIGDATVEKIESRHVVLLHEGEMKDFHLQGMQFIGAKGGGGRRDSRGEGPSPSMKGGTGSGKMQQIRMEAMKKREIEEMKRRSKEEINKMREEMRRGMMEGRFRGRRRDRRSPHD